MTCRLAFLILLLSHALLHGQAPELQIVLKTPPGQMRYDIAQFDAAPGQKVQLTLENNDEMPHNVVLCSPAGDKGLEVAKKAWEMGEKGPVNGWVPDHPRVLAALKLVNPHEKGTFSFLAPAEPGDYPYVCTFPGHAMTMNGIMKVGNGGPRLFGLKYKLFLGDWSRLPDFSKLKPHREGELPEGLVGWKFDDYKNQFGLEFTGKLRAEKKGTYKFFLASDDGAELLVDGQPVIQHDGIHPSTSIRTKDIRLEEGEHEVRLTYFEQGGQEELFLAWQGPGFSETPLSMWIPDNRRNPSRRRDDRTTGIPLASENGEAVIFRNFFEGSSPRGIAVGYPGGLNICYDADQMNLAMLWRGAFMDAKRHWSDRGAGNQPPLGYAVAKPVPPSVALAVLPDLKTPWPQRRQRADDCSFKGYRLDAKRFPTFQWLRGGLSVEERFDPAGDHSQPEAKIVRTLKFSGSAEPNLYFRAASGNITETGGGWQIDGVLLKVEGATPQLRGDGGSRELLIPVNPATRKDFRLTYQWAQ